MQCACSASLPATEVVLWPTAYVGAEGPTVGCGPHISLDDIANSSAVRLEARRHLAGRLLAGMQAIVETCLASGLPKDRNGAYFVISSADVAQGGFCTSYCGWHDDREGL